MDLENQEIPNTDNSNILNGIDVSDLKDSSTLKSNYDFVASQNPNDVADTVKLAKQFDESPIFISANLKKAREAAAAPDFDAISKLFPHTAKFFLDQEKMAQAYDDSASLMKLEAAGQVHNAIMDGSPVAANSMLTAFGGGLEHSVIGLMYGRPDVELPENAPFQQKLAYTVGNLIPDLPVMTAGSFLAAPAGPIAATAGAFALPTAIRQTILEHYKNGDINDTGELMRRIFAIGKETAKSAAIGAATAGAGIVAQKGVEAAAGVASDALGTGVEYAAKVGAVNTAKTAGELAGMTAAGAAVEGKGTSWEDLALNSIVIGLMHGTGLLRGKAQDMRAEAIKAETTKAAYMKMAEVVDQSPLKTRNPELLADHVDNVMLPAMMRVGDWDTFFQSQGLDPAKIAAKFGQDVKDSYDAAKSTGTGDVIIPASVATSENMKPYISGLSDNIRTEQNGMSLNDFQKQQEILKAAKTRSDKLVKDNADIKLAREQILQDVNQNMSGAMEKSIGAGAKESTSDVAQMFTNIIISQADARGYKSPMVFYNEIKRNNPDLFRVGEAAASVHSEMYDLAKDALGVEREAIKPSPEILQAKNAVFEDVKGRLLEIGRDESNADAEASLWASHVIAESQRRGIDPMELYTQSKLKPRAGIAPEGTELMQGGGKDYEKTYPSASDIVSGLKVRKHIPNQSSIEASISHPEYLNGVREVPLSMFPEPPTINERTKALAEAIKKSGEINPLIVGVDSKGPYIIEGAHRYDALKILGVKSIPAQVIIDTENPLSQSPAESFGGQKENMIGPLRKGSQNYQVNARRGMVEGEGEYADYEPHHAPGGIYTNMVDAYRDGKFIDLIDNKKDIEIPHTWIKAELKSGKSWTQSKYDKVDWDKDVNYYLQQNTGNGVKSHLLPKHATSYDGFNFDGETVENTDATLQLSDDYTENPLFQSPAESFYQSAWHGSPHDFDKFSLHKIGTGEGAQAYGWGLYFAGDKNVAEYYRQKLVGANFPPPRPDMFTVDGKSYAKENGKFLFILGLPPGDGSEITKAEYSKAFRAAQSEYEAKSKSGKLYEVDIPESDKLLDWDKPLSEQSEYVKEKLKDIEKNNANFSIEPRGKKFAVVMENNEYGTYNEEIQAKRRLEYLNKAYNDENGSLIYSRLTHSQPENKLIPKLAEFQTTANGEEAASRYLNSMGIQGLKYLDATSRGKGEGSRNYVIFDDKAVDIINKHYQGGSKEPRASYTNAPEGKFISMFKNSDATSLLHEMQHFWLDNIHEYVQSGKADEAYMKDWNTIEDYLGHKTGEKFTREQQEKWAESFERYIMDGKAPKPELEPAFARMKDWFIKIYDGAKKKLGIDKIPPEIRQVFDRMVGGKPDFDNFKYVHLPDLDWRFGATPKETGKKIRESFTSEKNPQIGRGNNLADEITRGTTEAERQGMFWYEGAKGNIDTIKQWANDEGLEKYKDQINAAINLSDKAKDLLSKGRQYYYEQGQVSKDVGSIHNIIEDYGSNRIYKEKEGGISTKTGANLKQTTGHGKARFFENPADAARIGEQVDDGVIRGNKDFATTDYAIALRLHNEEMARVNTSRALAENMRDVGLAQWRVPSQVPDGWKAVGRLSKQRPFIDKDGNPQIVTYQLTAPEGIADALKAISDPDYAKWIDGVRGVQKYQGLVKTFDLSLSLFHHFTFLMTALYSGGIRTLLEFPHMEEMLKSDDFLKQEEDFLGHTGITANVDANQDYLRDLMGKNKDFFGTLTELPVVKQGLESTNKSSNFLFGKAQRYLKVMNYAENCSKWLSDNPNATADEILEAKNGFAKAENAKYGGLNWDAMGIQKSHLSIARLILLAPDYTTANAMLFGYAFSKGTAGNVARKQILTSMLAGMVLTEGINYMLTGHYTDENEKGHFLEIQIAPGVYISLLRGGVGDIAKAASMIIQNGAMGIPQFLQGKTSPFTRTATGLLSNTQYTGVPITKRNDDAIKQTYKALKFTLANTTPAPFSATNAWQYLHNEDFTVPGAIAVGTGLGRFAKSRGAGEVR